MKDYSADPLAGLTLRSSGPAFGRPLKSNVRSRFLQRFMRVAGIPSFGITPSLACVKSNVSNRLCKLMRSCHAPQATRLNRCLGRPSVGSRLTAGAARHAAKAMQSRRAAHRTCSRRRCAGERRLSSLSCLSRCQHRIKVLRTLQSIAQAGAMRFGPSSAAAGAKQTAATGTSIALAQANAPAPNPSIERTSQSPLRALCAAAHVKR